MREQIGHPYRQTGQGKLYQRQSLVPQQAASRHRVGHQAGLHPEDTPYLTGQVQQPGQTSAEDEIEEDERYYASRQPTSAIRYRTTGRKQVIRQGNKQFVVHPHPPPARQRLLPPPRQHDDKEREPWQGTRRRFRFHPLVFIGFAMLLMLAGWVALTAARNWWQVTQDDWHYGRPRTFQADAVVGHNDSPANPSHFMAINLNRHIIVIECPGGDCSKAVVYTGPILLGDGQELTPVTLSFKDKNGDGKPDMFIHILDQAIPFINDNGKFRPAKPGEVPS